MTLHDIIGAGRDVTDIIRALLNGPVGAGAVPVDFVHTLNRHDARCIGSVENAKFHPHARLNAAFKAENTGNLLNLTTSGGLSPGRVARVASDQRVFVFRYGGFSRVPAWGLGHIAAQCCHFGKGIGLFS